MQIQNPSCSQATNGRTLPKVIFNLADGLGWNDVPFQNDNAKSKIACKQFSSFAEALRILLLLSFDINIAFRTDAMATWPANRYQPEPTCVIRCGLNGAILENCRISNSTA